MKVGYSILKEIHNKTDSPTASDYGLSEVDFQNFVFFLETKGYLERVLRVHDHFSLKAARLTEKGVSLLVELKHYEDSYPARNYLKAWVQSEKDLYSNGAEQE
ncbi:hypothetical protein [Paenisporosarcina indica]|uniref:hypothetical protein n=1 Tax=Paenisporosarcina indica TaxID=650093 RepID=UPI00094FE504|nr:hypothetical protein [Paenisporosarcina indica]